MAKKPATIKTVESLKHDEATRKNIPTAEYHSVMQKNEQSPVRVAYERRNRELDPQLVWRGKDEQDWSDLVVHAPPLYIQEKVHPKVLIDDLLKQTRESRAQELGAQFDLFGDFNGIPEGVDKTEFYQHDQNWSNRMKVNGVDVFHPIPAKSAATDPAASPAGSSTPTTTKKASSSATPTSSAQTIRTARSRPHSKPRSTKKHGPR